MIKQKLQDNILYATNFGTPEEIEEEINDWKDMDKLRTKS